MEHRNGSRKPVVMPVELSRSDKNYGHFMVANIGHGGLLLDGHGPFKKGEFLTAKIANTETASPRFHKLNVMVVHNSDSGIGLMWADYNIPFFNKLDQLISTAA